MNKLPRIVAVRVERETAETFHAVMAARGTTASAFLRGAIHSVTANDDRGDPPPAAPVTMSAAA